MNQFSISLSLLTKRFVFSMAMRLSSWDSQGASVWKKSEISFCPLILPQVCTASEILKWQSDFFFLKSRLSERFHRPEMSQIKAEISLRTNVKLIFRKNVGLQWYQWIPDFYYVRFWANLFNGKKLCGLNSYVIKIRESIDIIAILHFYDKSTSGWYEGWSQL